MTAFRSMTAETRAFVRSTWSASYRTSEHAGLLSMATYATVMHAEIDRLLDHSTTMTIVAQEPGETDHLGRPFVYGFISRRLLEIPEPYVYYVYVKTPYRRGKQKGLPQGYAARLFEAAGIDPRRRFTYACHTSYCDQLARQIPLASFNPLPARYLETI